LEEINKLKYYIFLTSCGNVLVPLDKITYAFCDVNLKGIENDIITDTKQFESKFKFVYIIKLTFFRVITRSTNQKKGDFKDHSPPKRINMGKKNFEF